MKQANSATRVFRANFWEKCSWSYGKETLKSNCNSRNEIEFKTVISIIKPTRCTNVSNLFYYGITLHVSDGL